MHDFWLNSWLDLAGNLTRNKRAGQERHMADLTILSCSDASEWDHYLSQCLLQLTAPNDLVIKHEQLEDLVFPLTPQRVQQFLSSKATLVIISPEFLDYIERKADVFQLGKLLKPSGTVAMLCGVREVDVHQIHKAALVSYDDWPILQAKDQDKDFVLDVLKSTREILLRNEKDWTALKPRFKLTPRKVKMGSNKVYILLNEPLNSGESVHVFLEGDGVREVSAKIKNPFTLQFFVPDSYLQTSRLMNVHVRSSSGPLLGVQPLKAESKMGELYGLLSSVNSPYELLCRTYGVSTYTEVDNILTDNFVQRVPSGYSLLDNTSQLDRKKSHEELPTLLHFSCRYGLHRLTSRLLMCPGALHACLMRNCRGLVPSQLAFQAGNRDIADQVEEFQNRPFPGQEEVPVEDEQISRRSSQTSYQEQSYVNIYSSGDVTCTRVNNDEYAVPSRTPVRVSLSDKVPLNKKPAVEEENRSNENGSLDNRTSECGYLDMRILTVFGKEKLTPSEALILEYKTREQEETVNQRRILRQREEISDVIVTDSETHASDELSSQTELLKIIERYKKGAQMSEVEKDFKAWQSKHKESDIETSLIRVGLNESVKDGKRKPEKKSSFRFPDFKYFVLSKFKKNEPNSATSSPRLMKRSLPLEMSAELDNRPVSTISTCSSASRASTSSSDRFSTLSFGSTSDSGNQSDSFDDILRTKEVHSETQSNPRQKLQNKLSLSLRPPAPPPRPQRSNIPLNGAHVPGDLSRVYYNESDLRLSMMSPEYVTAEFYPRDEPVKKDQKSTSELPGNPKFKSSCGDYYSIPSPPISLASRRSPSTVKYESDSIPDYSFPSKIAVPYLPAIRPTAHSDYYDVPKPGCPIVEQDPDRCDSIPDEIPPPPPQH